MSQHQSSQVGPIIAIILILTLLTIGAIYYLQKGSNEQPGGPALSAVAYR